MLPIFLNTLKGHRAALLMMALLITGLGILLATSYESFAANSAFLQELPKGFQALLKAEGNSLLGTGFQGYIAIGFRHPVFLITVSAFAIATASGALAREIERKTVLLLLASPLPRHHLVLSKGGESALGLLLLVAALLTGTFVGIQIAGLTDSVEAAPLLLMGFNALCLFLAIMGYSYLISALSSDGGHAILLSTALTVAFFFMDFMAGLFDFFEPLGLLSIFHYYDPLSLAGDGGFPGLHVGLLLGMAILTFGAALGVFQRRDIRA